MDSDKLSTGGSSGVSRRTLLKTGAVTSVAAAADPKKLHSVLTVLGGRVVHFGGIRYWA